MSKTKGPTGFGLYTVDEALRSYQKRNGLDVDGWARPDGPTISKMRAQFSGLLGGFPAPTPEQVDLHHARAQRGESGLLTTELPQPKLHTVLVPPADPQTRGSNKSLVDWILRNRTDDGGAPEMLATYIKNFGADGIAQARDYVAQWDAAKPGEGGKAIRAVLRHLPDPAQQRAFVGGPLPSGPPIGTLTGEGQRFLAAAAQNEPSGDAGQASQPDMNTQVAAVPLVLGAPAAIAAGAAILGGAGAKVILDQAAKPNQMPASPPPLEPHDASKTGNIGGSEIPSPSPPDNTGHDAQRPEGALTLENIPAVLPEVREEINGTLAQHIVERRYADDREDHRGTEATLLGNNILARECKAALDESKIAGIVEHLGGASRDGKDGKYMTEKTIQTDDGRRLPDYTMGPDPKDMRQAGHVNTASTRADGSLTPREQAARDAMERALPDKELIQTIPKYREGDDPVEYAKTARAACQKVVGALEKLLLEVRGGRN